MLFWRPFSFSFTPTHLHFFVTGQIPIPIGKWTQSLFFGNEIFLPIPSETSFSFSSPPLLSDLEKTFCRHLCDLDPTFTAYAESFLLASPFSPLKPFPSPKLSNQIRFTVFHAPLPFFSNLCIDCSDSLHWADCLSSPHFATN